MTDDDEREVVKVLKWASIVGWFSAGAGVFGLYVLLFTTQPALHTGLLLVGSLAAFYLAWITIFQGRQLTSDLEKGISHRSQRKANWEAKTSGQDEDSETDD
jgi:hypothetical protein